MIKYIEQYNLQQYSFAGLDKLPETDLAKTGEPDNVLPVETNDDKTMPAITNAVVLTDADKIISINNTKCVFVKKGTSLLVIAAKNNISLHKLMEFNDMTGEGILDKDQYIYLHKKPKTGDKEFYIVQAGETIYDVAQNAGIQLKYLLEYNGLNTGVKINANTKLLLQPGVKTTENNMNGKKEKVHLVAPKEGLYTIAKTYNVTVQQLIEWNKLGSGNLKIGQQIIVSK